MDAERFDVIILGGGPGGYVAAIRAAELGKKVALVEEAELGGTCLNRGCIPSKALIANASFYDKAKHASRYGIHFDGLTLNFPAMQLNKDKTVEKLRRGIEGLIAAHQISLFRGRGQLVSPYEMKVLGERNHLLHGEFIILATGSSPRALPHLPFDGERVHDSTSFLNLEQLPNALLVVGGGVIGCEFASLMRALDVEVTVVELLPRLLPAEAENVSSALSAAFKRRGIAVHTGVSLQAVLRKGEKVGAQLSNGEQLLVDCVLVSVGRAPLSEGIGLDLAGVAVNAQGAIEVNETLQTSVPHIYAIGDVTGKWNLAHVASHQGLVAVEHLAGHAVRMSYRAIPSVIFTTPEIATCGLSLKQAQERGYAAEVGKFPFQALGKAQATQEPEGFAEIVVDRTTGEILGGQVVGYGASNLIAELALAIENELTVESLTETIHAHPTFAEAWMEAGLLAQGLPLHVPPSKSNVRGE